MSNENVLLREKEQNIFKYNSKHEREMDGTYRDKKRNINDCSGRHSGWGKKRGTGGLRW